MPQQNSAGATQQQLPIILIRGFGGLDVEDERKNAYQGFNVGTVYPHKRGENYIYEGMILRFMKSGWKYQDATNVVGYYDKDVTGVPPMPDHPGLQELDRAGFFSASRVVLDPAMALQLLESDEPQKTLWVLRYYDLGKREIKLYGEMILRVVDLIRKVMEIKGHEATRVNVIAHSMGGLLIREAIQVAYPAKRRNPADFINKVVTLGTPHQGISFQLLENWLGAVAAQDELEAFNPDKQKLLGNKSGFRNFAKHFPLDRLLTVVGTNYRTYEVGAASRLNRLFSVSGEYGSNYNRSDGLVKQALAQIPGAPRTFVHKCHGGFDSLVTARESFEIATRFFFGDVVARLYLKQGRVTRGKDFFGKSEFFFGVGIKPRGVDFELFHQSAEAENCYGPFSTADLSDADPAFGWAGENRLIWEGFLDTREIHPRHVKKPDMVLRLDIYVGERDLFGVGFSDNVVFRKQYYVRALLDEPHTLYLHTGEEFRNVKKDEMKRVDDGWEFEVSGTGFTGTLRIELESRER